jgi:hypothetical protein
MISRIIFLPALLVTFIVLLFYQACHQPDNGIQRAVKAQLIIYPESGLQDIYKSFFQDEYGPGHLLTDSADAWQYLESEISEMTSSGNHTAEPCGKGENFYRVPLDLVKDGIISDSSLFRAFMESASSFRVPEIESWKKKWEKIEAVIEGMKLNLPNYEEDKKALSDMLSQGKTAVHHSQKYEERYNPHYRIVAKEQWERLKAQYLN